MNPKVKIYLLAGLSRTSLALCGLIASCGVVAHESRAGDAAYTALIDASHPEIHLAFDEMRGAKVARDSSGKHQDANYGSGVRLGVASISPALETAASNTPQPPPEPNPDLVGTTGAVALSVSKNSPALTGDVTIELWVYITNTGGNYQTDRQILWSFGGNADYNPGGLLYTQDGNLVFFDNAANFSVSKIIAANQWTLVDFVRADGVDNLYVDGVLKTPISAGSASEARTNDENADGAHGVQFIGDGYAVGGGLKNDAGLQGSLDEFVVYTSALSAKTIMAHYQASRARK